MQPTPTSRAKHNVLTSCKFSTGTKARSCLRSHELRFPLHRRLAVFGAHDPTVKVGYDDVVGACVGDRLDCEAHARHENRALPASVAWRGARRFRDVGFAPFLPELCLGKRCSPSFNPFRGSRWNMEPNQPKQEHRHAT